MKQILIPFLFIAISVQAFAQSSFRLSVDTSHVVGNLSDYYVDGTSYIFMAPMILANKTTDTVNLRWQRINYATPQGWSNSVCDFFVCLDTSIATGGFAIQPKDSGQISIDFYPVSIGTGVSALHIQNIQNPSDEIYATFVGEISQASGVASVKQVKDVYLSPVPVIDNLSVTYDKSVQPNRMEVYNVLGQVIKSTKVSSASGVNVQMNLAQLDNGIYFLKVYTVDNKEFTRRFTKG